MSRMSEYAMEQEERENESGIDDAECYEWHEKNRLILNELGKIAEEMKNGKKRNTNSTQTPF